MNGFDIANSTNSELINFAQCQTIEVYMLSLGPMFYVYLFSIRGCSYTMSAKSWGLQTPLPPLSAKT